MAGKIIYQGLGHKWGFGNYSLITHYSNGNSTIEKISKAVFNSLKNSGFAVEC